MKIIVNAIPLNNIATGIGRYLKCLYNEIHKQRPDLTIRYFDGGCLRGKIPESPQKNSLWALAVNVAWKLPPLLTYWLRIIAHQKSAKLFLKLAKGFDLYHEAGYFPFISAPHIKTVFTLHDLSLKVLPHFHPKDRVLFFQKIFQQSLCCADAIITPSKFTQDELRHHYPEVTMPVFAIPLGFKTGIFYEERGEIVNAVKLKMNLPPDYVLFVGTSDPRKNIRGILRAIELLPASIKLVVTGWSGWEGYIKKDLSIEALKDRIIFTGYVADQDLAALYAGARVFVYPSYYEGFGLPVLEAMACGCPVICSDRGSIPEVVGDAGITCSPDDPERMAFYIKEVLGSDRLYFEMQQKGLQQAKKFSWAFTAKETLKVFDCCFTKS